MTRKIFSIILLICSFSANAQFFKKLTDAVGSIASAAVQTVTAPTQAVINTVSAVSGNGSVSDIYKPYQQAYQQTGTALAQSTSVLNDPQSFFMSKAQDFARQNGGDAGDFIFDVSTFSNRYYSELANAGANNINGILHGQNPFQVTALPLAAAIRAAREKYKDTAMPLPDDVKNALRPYFSESVINNARYVIGKVEITLPNFIGQGQKLMGGDYAVTVDNIIVFNRNPGGFVHSGAWWVHEVTHVEQYQRLGIETFAYNYLRDLGNSLENEANQKSKNITGRQINQGYALNQSSFDMSNSSIDDGRNFATNPEYYVAQCIFNNDSFGCQYLVTNYGRIIAVNPVTGQWLHIGYSTPPRLLNVAWSYDLPNARYSYAVGFDGLIRDRRVFTNQFGQSFEQWIVVGHVVKFV